MTAIGCGASPNRRVWGDVSYDGTPIESGAIEFIPSDGSSGPSTGGAITNGRYDIPATKGPLADSTYRVELRAVRDTGIVPPGPRHSKASPKAVAIIPPKYNVRSTLKVTIQSSDENRFDFVLKK